MPHKNSLHLYEVRRWVLWWVRYTLRGHRLLEAGQLQWRLLQTACLKLHELLLQLCRNLRSQSRPKIIKIDMDQSKSLWSECRGSSFEQEVESLTAAFPQHSLDSKNRDERQCLATDYRGCCYERNSVSQKKRLGISLNSQSRLRTTSLDILQREKSDSSRGHVLGPR